MNRPRVAFLVNGTQTSAMAERARALASRLSGRFDIALLHRSSRGIDGAMRLWRSLRSQQPGIVYVLDMGAAGVIAAWGYRRFTRHARVVIDTGDAIYELVRSSGMRGRIGQGLTWGLERFALAMADHLVVRGTFHKELLVERGHDPSRISVVQDGVDLAQFAPRCGKPLRDQLGQNGQLVVGLIGSSVWSDRLQMCYGWDLVEAMYLLKDQPVKGMLIGDGNGIEHLRRRCREYGIEDKVIFLGRIEYERLAEYLAAMDVCLSTQTNDIPGRVRTTGKLPLYLAAGKHVLASKVGEAERVLPEAMLIDYHGTRDESYPQRLAERIRSLLRDRSCRLGSSAVQIARQHFDYDVLAPRIGDVLEKLAHV